MTVLYRPVLIETAEQAEALPEGTVAYGHFWDGDHEPMAAVRLGDGWELSGLERPGRAPSTDVIGFQAFLPIEAEEERRPDTTAIRPWGETTPDPLPEHTRLVTPWEEA